MVCIEQPCIRQSICLTSPLLQQKLILMKIGSTHSVISLHYHNNATSNSIDPSYKHINIIRSYTCCAICVQHIHRTRNWVLLIQTNFNELVILHYAFTASLLMISRFKFPCDPTTLQKIVEHLLDFTYIPRKWPQTPTHYNQ